MMTVELVPIKYRWFLPLLLVTAAILLSAILGGWFEAATLADFESTSTEVPSEPEVYTPGLSPIAIVAVMVLFGRMRRAAFR